MGESSNVPTRLPPLLGISSAAFALTAKMDKSLERPVSGESPDVKQSDRRCYILKRVWDKKDVAKDSIDRFDRN